MSESKCCPITATKSETKCLCEGNGVIIYSCSGASNVGQIANKAAVELAKEGIGKMNCITGVGGHISGMLASGKAAEKIIAIDGCPVKCVEKTLQHAEIKPTNYTVITELGIKKISGEFSFTDDEVKRVKENVLKALGYTANGLKLNFAIKLGLR